MEINWYSDNAVFIQKIKFTDALKVKVNGYVKFMACDDKSCLPPTKRPFALTLSASTAATSVEKEPEIQKPTVIPLSNTSDYWTPVITELKSFGETKDSTTRSTTRSPSRSNMKKKR